MSDKLPAVVSEPMQMEDFVKKFSNPRAYCGLVAIVIVQVVFIVSQVFEYFGTDFGRLVTSSVGTGILLIFTLHVVLNTCFSTTVKVEKSMDRVVVTYHQLLGRSYQRMTAISQMSSVEAKALRDKHGKYGYNVYFNLKNSERIIFFAKDDLSVCRDLDEISNVCLGKECQIDDGNCCSSDCKCICPINYQKMFGIFILTAIFYIAISIGAPILAGKEFKELQDRDDDAQFLKEGKE